MGLDWVAHPLDWEAAIPPRFQPGFSARFLEVDWIPKSLQDEAYVDHDAKECLAYAQRLSIAACSHIRTVSAQLRKSGDEEILGEYEEAQATHAHSSAAEQSALPDPERALMKFFVGFEAAAWLRYWANRGHGFRAVS